MLLLLLPWQKYKDRVVPEAVLARCIRQVLEFLNSCHENNVCFGDVKPRCPPLPSTSPCPLST